MITIPLDDKTSVEPSSLRLHSLLFTKCGHLWSLYITRFIVFPLTFILLVETSWLYQLLNIRMERKVFPPNFSTRKIYHTLA